MGINVHPACKPRPWAEDRKFEPFRLYADHVKVPDDVEVRGYDGRWTYVACEQFAPCPTCGRLSPHIDYIVIAVDGACRGNGHPGARAAIGVFVGNESQHNWSAILSDEAATNQIAELAAGILGLHAAMQIYNTWDDETLHQVVIKADSEYLVKGMTEWVFKWERNGYRTSKGTPVTNKVLFQALVEKVKELNERNVEVLFWHVPRAYNKEADKLANKALDDA